MGEAVLDPIRSRGPTTLLGRSVRRSKLDRWASHRLGERGRETAPRRGKPNRRWPAASSNATSGCGSEPRPAAETTPPVRTGPESDPANGPQWRPTGGRQSLATLIRSLPQNLRQNMRGRQGLPRTRRKTGPWKETLPMTITVPNGITCAFGRGSTYIRTQSSASLAPVCGRLPYGRRKRVGPHMLNGSRRRPGIVSSDNVDRAAPQGIDLCALLEQVRTGRSLMDRRTPGLARRSVTWTRISNAIPTVPVYSSRPGN